jgi:hypothetical protein
MILGACRLKTAVFVRVFVLASVAVLAGCGGYTPPNQNNPGSGAKFRAFVSQNVSSVSGVSAGLDIVDATLDRLIRAPGVTVGTSPSFMQVSANKQRTLVFDSASNAIFVVTNSSETASGHVNLPDFTESMAISTDGTIGFAAVPNAPVLGQPSGTVEVIGLANPALGTPVAVPGAHFLVLSPDNTKLLVFSDSMNAVTLIPLTNSGTVSSPNWVVGQPVPVTASFDQPVWGVFSSDSNTAFILNCGDECGGTAASVLPVDLGNSAVPVLGTPIPVPAATYGAIFGNNLYVAGTSSSSANKNCAGANTTALVCGRLTVIDASARTVSNAAPIIITDGTHNRMSVTSDNQVFVGAQHCSEISSRNEQRGCLSIYNPSLNKVVIGTDHGDVTGIAPVTGRNQVYVVENGEFRIWSTLNDALLPSNKQFDISGQAQDVVIVD